MATYYIDPSSAINGAGTELSPFNTWSAVTWGSGNSYLQKAGTTYIGQIAPTVAAAGTATAKTILSTYGGTARAKIQGTNQYQGIRLVQNTHHVTIENFEIYGVDKTNAGTGTTGIFIGSGDTLNCNNVKISNCFVYSMTPVVGYDCNGIKFFGNNIEILNCIIDLIPTDGIWGYGLAPHIHHNRISRCDLDNRDAGDAIQLTYACDGAHIHHNILDRANSPSKQVLIISSASAGYGAIIEYNTMIGHPFVSIQTSCVYSDQPGTIVRKNLLVGCYRAIYFDTTATNCVADSNICVNNTIGIQTANATLACSFVNNTIISSTLYGAYLSDNTAIVKNNLFYNCAKGLAIKSTGTNNYNAYFGNTIDFESISGGAVIGVNKVSTDPQLSSFYYPATNSPLHEAGTFLFYSSDFSGKQRNNPPSIGAYEYVNVRGTR
jgi:hypothetical protein